MRKNVHLWLGYDIAFNNGIITTKDCPLYFSWMLSRTGRVVDYRTSHQLHWCFDVLIIFCIAANAGLWEASQASSTKQSRTNVNLYLTFILCLLYRSRLNHAELNLAGPVVQTMLAWFDPAHSAQFYDCLHCQTNWADPFWPTKMC